MVILIIKIGLCLCLGLSLGVGLGICLGFGPGVGPGLYFDLNIGSGFLIGIIIHDNDIKNKLLF